MSANLTLTLFLNPENWYSLGQAPQTCGACLKAGVPNLGDTRDVVVVDFWVQLHQRGTQLMLGGTEKPKGWEPLP